MMYPKPTRTTGLSALDAKLWRVFSEFIRRRDCDCGDALYPGYTACITCGRVKPYAELDAGHFVGRRHKATKFDERNVNAQCRRCNRFESGESYTYGKAIDSKYGQGTAEALYTLSRARGTKLTRDWYMAKIAEYTAKVKSMRK